MAYEYKELECGTNLKAYRYVDGWCIEVRDNDPFDISIVEGTECGRVGLTDVSLPNVIKFLQQLERSHLKEPKDGSRKG